MFSFFSFDLFFLRFCVFFFKSLYSGRSKVTRGTVGRDIHQPTNQSFRVCKVNLATLRVAMKKPYFFGH